MKKSTIVTIFLFLSIYIIGLFAANDYGISWDENTHRIFGQKTIVYIIKYTKIADKWSNNIVLIK